jgi:predicted ArsR family transcriptional regulator
MMAARRAAAGGTSSPDAAAGLGASPNEVRKALDVLEAQGRVQSRLQGGRLFFWTAGGAS